MHCQSIDKQSIGNKKTVPTLQEQYHGVAGALRAAAISMLDLESEAWPNDFAAFQKSVAGLEGRLVAAMKKGFDLSGALSTKLDLLKVTYNTRHQDESSSLAPNRTILRYRS